MMRAATSAMLACLVCACPAPARRDTPPQPHVDDRAVRVQIAKAEAARADGIAELVTIANGGDRHAQLLALRGLGRSGAVDALVRWLDDPDPEVAATAMAAIGVARELDDLTLPAPVQAKLRAAFGRSKNVLAIEALGRAGDQDAQPLLAAQLAGAPELAEAAGVALARHGRRKIALTPATIAALLPALDSPDPRVRYAAMYAFARASGPIESSDVASAIAKRVADPSAEVRAQAMLALAKQGRSLQPAEAGLVDRDWRVAVEAVRALTGDKASGDFADAVATGLVRRLSDPHDGDVHVLLEGLRGLQKQAARPVVAQAVRFFAQWAEQDHDLDHQWVECLAIEAEVRNGSAAVAALSRCPLPDHLKLPLLADLVTANVGSLADRRTSLATLLANPDPRVRAAGLGAIAAPWKESSDADHAAAIGVVTAALAAPNPLVSGAAVDAAGSLYEVATDHSALDQAVIARATTEADPDLSSALYALIGKQKVAAGEAACRAGLTAAPARAKAARECLRALGEAAPAGPAAKAEVPPVDVTTVIGKHIEWHLETTRGELVVELFPDVAPWAVASIVSLTRAGKYDNLEMHRVVPDFVAQGGDPTESGAGGPGYSLPAEPGTAADGPGYVAGGVGMADAGRDTAGSQWFVMHARAAHLDGRYTWVGRLLSGQKSADALQIGDKVTRATIVVGT